MLIPTILAYLDKLLQQIEEPQTYGSALERYIAAKHPQSTYDVEYWARRFDEKMAARSESGWPL
jgi:hypothetical protein